MNKLSTIAVILVFNNYGSNSGSNDSQIVSSSSASIIASDSPEAAISQEGLFAFALRKVHTVISGHAVQFCSEIDNKYYDSNKIDTLDIEHRGERAITDALNTKNVAQVCKIITFFKEHANLKLNERHSKSASDFLKERVSEFLTLIKYTDQKNSTSLAAIQTVEQAWQKSTQTQKS